MGFCYIVRMDKSNVIWWLEIAELMVQVSVCNAFLHNSPPQERLEELLRIYPPEDVEAKRWQKIANTLGNRTAKQVRCTCVRDIGVKKLQ